MYVILFLISINFYIKAIESSEILFVPNKEIILEKKGCFPVTKKIRLFLIKNKKEILRLIISAGILSNMFLFIVGIVNIIILPLSMFRIKYIIYNALYDSLNSLFFGGLVGVVASLSNYIFFKFCTVMLFCVIFGVIVNIIENYGALKKEKTNITVIIYIMFGMFILSFDSILGDYIYVKLIDVIN